MKTKILPKCLFILSFAILSIILLPLSAFAERGFSSAVNYTVGNIPVSVTSGDFNKDGDLDLAVANVNSSNVSILLGVGDGSFNSAVNYTVGVGNNPQSVTSGDFDKNGNLDLAVTNANSSNVSILLNIELLFIINYRGIFLC